jgi:hypothetical protein
MTKRLCFWILMLLWLVLGVAWHFAMFGGIAVYGLALIPFLLLLLLGWQVFGAPLQG